MKTLIDFGLNPTIKKIIDESNAENFVVGRITKQHKDIYHVITDDQHKHAVITGNLRYGADRKADYPLVGDWVALINSEDIALIIKIFPRQTLLQRQDIRLEGETQPIAANLDFALIVQAVDQNFNINRLERYVTICYNGDIAPVILLNKIDLISKEQLEMKISSVRNRLQGVSIITTTLLDDNGLVKLKEALVPGKSYCLIGSSGVGKSSIINGLVGGQKLKTGDVSKGHNKGKHTTTHRELIIMPNGSILIDTPGMRELGVAESEEGLTHTFESIETISQNCQFSNCSHDNEPNCAVKKAIEEGDLNELTLNNYKKLKRESERFSLSKMEKRKKDKNQGKMYKSIIKNKQRRKF